MEDEANKKAHLVKEFKKFDKDKNGFLDAKEIKQWLLTLGWYFKV
jgi:Ca2+-binding EF-hand superfamily protein